MFLTEGSIEQIVVLFFFYIKGKLVYANYGRLEDLDVVLKKDIELNGSVLLLRKGKISYAEKVQVCSSPSWATVVV